MKQKQYGLDKIAFSQREKILFSVNNTTNTNWPPIKEHNYTTNETSDRYVDYPIYPNIILHPKENVLCAGNGKETFLYTIDNLQIQLKNNNPEKFDAHNYQYSHDGSFIVATGFNKIRIMNEQLTHLFSFLTKNEFKKFDATKLNSDSTILAVLVRDIGLKRFYRIKYYDIPTKKCIYSKQINNRSFNCSNDPHVSLNDLSFSPDETKLMITMNGKCFITLTPFGIKQGAFIHWILKNYQTNSYEIPAEIVQHIVNNYIEIL